MRLRSLLVLSGGVSLALAVSGFVPLPVPTGLLERLAADEGYRLSAESVHLRWARGEVTARGLRLTRASPAPISVMVGEARLRLDLRPQAPRFARPWEVVLSGVGVEGDVEALRTLAERRGEGRGATGLDDDAVGPLRVVVEDLRIALRSPERRWEFRCDTLRLALSDRGLASGATTLVAHEPVPGTLRLGLRADGDAWELRGELDVPTLPDAETLGAEGWIPPLVTDHSVTRLVPRWREAALRAAVVATPEAWQVSVEARAAEVGGEVLPWQAHDFRLVAAGDLLRALDVSAGLSLDGEVPWSFRGAARPIGSVPAGRPPTWSDWRLRLEGAAEVPMTADEALPGRFARLLPILEDVLWGLGLDGEVRPRFALSKSAGEVVPHVGVGGAVRDFGFRYRGIRDPDTGERFSFALPLQVTDAFTVFGDGVLAFAGAGVAGAEPDRAGADVDFQGIVDFRSEDAILDLEVAAPAMPVDDRVGAALSDNPGFDELWTTLGEPRGGVADARFSLWLGTGEPRLRLRADVRGGRAEPPDLGFPVALESGRLVVARNAATFSGEVVGPGAIRTVARGAVAAVAGARGALLSVTGDVRGPWPGPGEVPPRLGAMPVPEPLTSLRCDDPLAAHFEVRSLLDEAGAADTAFLCSIGGEALHASWPWAGLDLPDFRLDAQVWSAGRTTTFAATGSGSGGDAFRDGRFTLRGRAGDDAPRRGDFVVQARDWRLTDPQVDRWLTLAGAPADWVERLRFGGRASLAAWLPLARPGALEADLRLDDLEVHLPPDPRLGLRTALDYRLTGGVTLARGRFVADGTHLVGPNSDLLLEECRGRLTPDLVAVDARVQSLTGIDLVPQLQLVAPERVLDSVAALGIAGQVRPRDVDVGVRWRTGEPPVLTAKGRLDLMEFRLDGPPPVRHAHGHLQVDSFTWRGAEDFRGAFRLEDGWARVSGIPVRDAEARVVLEPETLRVEGFRANALGGEVYSRTRDAQGRVVPGVVSLGLGGSGAIRAALSFRDLRLEELGDRLGLPGGLRGRLGGWFDVRSPDPFPGHYKGRAHLEIGAGRLGAAPVLAQLWRAAGIEEPVFDNGSLDLTFTGNGTMRVEDLSLRHPLLEVHGENWMTVDSYLDLKVTIRTFGFLGRMPVVRDVLDWFIEQDVWGPAANPRIRQRALSKLFRRSEERVPFPLWAPTPVHPDWRRSPVLPARTAAEVTQRIEDLPPRRDHDDSDAGDEGRTADDGSASTGDETGGDGGRP